MRRQIIYSKPFDHAADALGGYWMVDKAIDTVMEALARNPYGFHKFENDYVSFRYAVTKRISDVPSMVVIFTIDDKGNVTLEHIEENLIY